MQKTPQSIHCLFASPGRPPPPPVMQQPKKTAKKTAEKTAETLCGNRPSILDKGISDSPCHKSVCPNHTPAHRTTAPLTACAASHKAQPTAPNANVQSDTSPSQHTSCGSGVCVGEALRHSRRQGTSCTCTWSRRLSCPPQQGAATTVLLSRYRMYDTVPRSYHVFFGGATVGADAAPPTAARPSSLIMARRGRSSSNTRSPAVPPSTCGHNAGHRTQYMSFVPACRTTWSVGE